MIDAEIFSASEAARITGVSPETQQDWRRRGFLPRFGRKHARWTVRELCRLRLMRALTEIGFPVRSTESFLSGDFVDSLQSQVISHSNGSDYDAMLAVIGRVDGVVHRYVVFKLADLSVIEKDIGCPFETFHVIRLAKIAEDLVNNGIIGQPGLRERN